MREAKKRKLADKLSSPGFVNDPHVAHEIFWGAVQNGNGELGIGMGMTPPEQGNKDDEGKLPWALLPFDAIGQVVEVLHFGKKKYEARNWEKGINYDRCFSAAMRHMIAWWDGETHDPESKLHHLAHAICCLMFLLAFELRAMFDLDNRPNHPTI